MIHTDEERDETTEDGHEHDLEHDHHGHDHHDHDHHEIEHAYLLEVRGMPTLKLRMEIHPPKDFKARGPADYMMLGMIITGLPVVNAIRAVVAAPPGIRTYADLPLTTAAGFAGGG